MKALLRVITVLIIAAAVVVLGAWAGALIFGGMGGNRQAQLPQPADQALIQKGAYIAVLSDCAACHTVPGGHPYAGGLPIESPVGVIFSSNITPDKGNGIGNYTYGDFERAVRRGIRPDGTTLYPAMPYPSFARLTDADTQALYAYFMNAVAPVSDADMVTDIPWPLSMRWPLTYWRWLFAPAVQPATEAGNSDALLARGAYLVQGPGHCGACHTPRAFTLQEVALTGDDPAFLSGAELNHFDAADLRGDPLTGLGSWSEDDIVQFLRTGHNAHAAVFAGMSDVVTFSTQHMTDDDLRAIAHYLKSLHGTRNEPAFAYDDGDAKKLAALNVSAPGALDYMNNCAACHLSSGKGYSDTFPALAGNPLVMAPDPETLIILILNGSTRVATDSAPTSFAMPGFATRLTDQQIADLVSFIRSSWGNQAGPVSADEVTKLRAQLNAPSPNVSGQ
jgi:alcohol dehydrogenase (quinone), cytochrome c subunit